MKNKMDDLRNHLFATIESLLDDEQPMEVERAKAVAQVAGVLIESAKVEILHRKTFENTEPSEFLQTQKPKALQISP